MRFVYSFIICYVGLICEISCKEPQGMISVRTGFRSGDSSILSKLLDDTGKVQLEAPDFGVQKDSYSAGQVVQQLRKIFQQVKPVDFQIDSDSKTVHGSGVWTVKWKSNGRKATFVVYAGFKQKGDTLRLDSLRIIKR